MLHLRSLMNDYHLRDLSYKIKSVLLSKKKSGQCLSFKAPYGYQKGENNKCQLVVDGYAAGVVRKMFDLRKDGMSTSRIAAFLNNEHILPPMAYWYWQNGRKNPRGSTAWTSVVVMGILRSEVYLGNLIMNYVGSRSYKDGTMVRKPPDEWVRCEGTHEAIITQEVWSAVQEINMAAVQRCAGRRAPAQYLFSGKLICADCGGALVGNTERKRHNGGNVKKYISYHCGRHSTSGQSVCSWHTIYEKPLIRIVAAEIKNHAQAVTLDEAALVDKLKRRIANYDVQRLSGINQEIHKLRRRVQELEAMTAKLYEDKYSGAISETTFIVLSQKNEQERLAKAEHLQELLGEAERVEKETAAIYKWTATIRKHLDMQELDRAAIDELIDHIEVGERTIVAGQRRQDIKVFYHFVGLVE